jgi:hypothetical protein
MTTREASRGQRLVSAPDLRAPPGSLAPLPQCLACAGALRCRRGTPEHLLNNVPQCRDGARFTQPWAATLRQKRLVIGCGAIPREKHHPLAQRGRSLLQLGIEGAPVELGHAQVTQDHVIGLRLERSQGVPAIARRCHHVPVALEEPGQRADQAGLIIND